MFFPKSQLFFWNKFYEDLKRSGDHPNSRQKSKEQKEKLLLKFTA